jgi:serine/threonine protein kinase
VTNTDVTTRESDLRTIKESPWNASAGATLRDAGNSAGSPIAPRTFRGAQILEQLPTKGAEADIFVVDDSGEQRVLKLYRHKLEPKIEILSRITEISRENSRCFVTYFKTGFDEETGRWYELQEFIQNGSVSDLSRDVKRSEIFVSQFTQELAEAIQCLHDNGIIHCDIKPANVLVRDLEPLDLVLADFGISSLMASDASRKMTGLKGTPMYWAPEAFSRVIGRASDWWGLGMMLLEMLAGEHPFEGLSGSEIIKKLTLGNVDVPESLGPDWGLLVKGLLTKDDSRRWGKNEIDRWLAGARDIPVFHDAGEIADDSIKPFKLAGSECRSVTEIAAAIAGSEEPWDAPGEYLRRVRHWYESNLMFDEASALGRVISAQEPEAALFRFVHANANMPFCVLGHRTDAAGLHEILRRSEDGAASRIETRLLEMLDDGGLLSYYREYMDISGGDESFVNLLNFMAGKSRREQAGYAGAASNPSAYVMPDDARCGTIGECLDVFVEIGRPPLSRAMFDDLTSRFALPAALLEMFRSASTGRFASEKLERWRDTGLLIPRLDAVHLPDDLSVDNYEEAARVVMLGYTPSVAREVDELRRSAALLRLSDEEDRRALGDATSLLAGLRDRKITTADVNFMDETSALIGKMKRTARNSGRYCALAAVAAVALMAALRACYGSYAGMDDQEWGELTSSLLSFTTICYILFKMGLLRAIMRLLAHMAEIDENNLSKREAEAEKPAGGIGAAILGGAVDTLLDLSDGRLDDDRRHRSNDFLFWRLPYLNTIFMMFAMIAFVVGLCALIQSALVVENPDDLRDVGLLLPLIGIPIGVGAADTAVNVSLASDTSAIMDKCRKYIDALKNE